MRKTITWEDFTAYWPELPGKYLFARTDNGKQISGMILTSELQAAFGIPNCAVTILINGERKTVYVSSRCNFFTESGEIWAVIKEGHLTISRTNEFEDSLEDSLTLATGERPLSGIVINFHLS